MAKYCTKCGMQLSAEDMFCGNCGNIISSLGSPEKRTSIKKTGNFYDIQFLLRIISPLIIGLGFIIGAFITEEYVMLLIAIIPLCITIAGYKSFKRRCPHCNAWNPWRTIHSNCTGHQKVKVRRNLRSSYWRTSGMHTFGSHQVFVSADEYVYNETYQCSFCGYEISGTRKIIDDGIR